MRIRKWRLLVRGETIMNKLLLSYIIGLIVGAGSVLAIVEIVLK